MSNSCDVIRDIAYPLTYSYVLTRTTADDGLAGFLIPLLPASKPLFLSTTSRGLVITSNHLLIGFKLVLFTAFQQLELRHCIKDKPSNKALSILLLTVTKFKTFLR